MKNLLRGAADRLLERFIPKEKASAASSYVFCRCVGPHGMYKRCDGSWCTDCVYLGHYCV